MGLLTLSLMGIQAFITIKNHTKNQKLTEQIKREQQDARLAELANNQRRDMARFRHLCELQEKLENESHANKIASIRQDFLDTLRKMFKEESLDTYMLKVSPFVLQRSIIPTSVEDINRTREQLLCILTGSEYTSFNRDVLPYLDDAICDFISSHWNNKGSHTIIYYENIWDCEKRHFRHEDVENLQPWIPNATLSITPSFKKIDNGSILVLRLSLWGVGNKNIDNVEMPTNHYFSSVPTKFSLSDINNILKDVTIVAVCAIAQMADLFYWATEYKPPLFPYLLESGIINVPDDIRNNMINIYALYYRNLAIGVFSENLQALGVGQIPSTLVEIAQYNHPERSLAFLKNVIMLSKTSSITSELISDSLISLYKVRTGKDVKNISEIDGALFAIEDFEIINELLQLSNNVKDASLSSAFVRVLKEKIQSWPK